MDETKTEGNKMAARRTIEIPEIFHGYMNDLVQTWNDWDIEERDALRAKGSAAYVHGGPYATVQEECRHIDWDIYHKFYKSDEEINHDNTMTARNLIISLIKRTEKKVGTITDYSMLTVTKGNFMEGGAAINGIIKGKNGTVEVRSIYAGGYNIQKLHVRVLVK
jgi:hypothetical protein